MNTRDRLGLCGASALPCLTAGMAFSWLLKSVSPGLSFQDGAELCHAGALLGIAHPPGFPLWVLVARMSCLLPLGAWPMRINLLSAACIGGCSFFLCKLGENRAGLGQGVAALAGLCLLWGERLWRQGVGCEVYALQIFLMSVCLWLIAGRRKKPRGVSVGLFLGFLLCAHPPLGVMMTPFLWGVWARRRGRAGSREWPIMAAMAAVAMSCWLLLPIRAGHGSEVLWSDTSQWTGLFRHGARSGYPLENSWAQLGNLWPQLRVAWSDLFQSHGWFVAAIAVVGLCRSPFGLGACLLLWTYGATSLALCFLMEGSPERWELMANRVFFLPGSLAAALLFGEGTAGMVRWIQDRASRRIRLVLLLCVPIPLLFHGVRTSVAARLRPCWAGDDWAGLMRQVSQGQSRILVATDSSEFMASFQASVSEGRRRKAIHRHAWGEPFYMDGLDLSSNARDFFSAGQWFFMGGESGELGLAWEYDAVDSFPVFARSAHVPIEGPLLGFPPGAMNFRVLWPVPWDSVVPDEGARSFFGHLYFGRGWERQRREQIGVVADYARCLLIEPDHLPCWYAMRAHWNQDKETGI